MLFNLIKILVYIPLWLMFPTFFKGMKNLPKGRAIIICNHTSNIDPALVEFSSWRIKYYLAKKELYKNKFVGGFLKRIRTIPIQRGKSDIAAIKACLNVLNKNKILVMFPEGTRNKKSEALGEVKGGAAMFAIKTRSPIVPVWIKKRPRLFRFNTLRYGKPFTLEEFYDKKLDSEVLEQAGKIIAQKLLESKI